jgi:integrase
VGQALDRGAETSRDALRRLLDAIPKRATTVLTNTRGHPWTANGFGTSFDDAKIAANVKEVDLHFHDLRGTAATKFYVAGIPIRLIAEIMAWDEDSVEKIIRRYVNRAALTKALIEQLNEAGTKSGKPTGKLEGKIKLSIGAGEGNRTLVLSLEG